MKKVLSVAAGGLLLFTSGRAFAQSSGVVMPSYGSDTSGAQVGGGFPGDQASPGLDQGLGQYGQFQNQYGDPSGGFTSGAQSGQFQGNNGPGLSAGTGGAGSYGVGGIGTNQSGTNLTGDNGDPDCPGQIQSVKTNSACANCDCQNQNQLMPSMWMTAPQGVPDNAMQASYYQEGKATAKAGEQGFVQGTVERVSSYRGIVQLESASGGITIHAKPNQVVSLIPGEVVRISYGNFGGQLWMLNNLNDQSINRLAFATSGTLLGTVANVNKDTGQIALQTVQGKRMFMAHPAELAPLVPGQFVALSFARIGNNDWVNSIRPGTQMQGNMGIQQ